jgi:hypothetical protein
MIFLLTAQMGIFIHLKSFRVNQIVFVVAAVTLSSRKKSDDSNHALHPHKSLATQVH